MDLGVVELVVAGAVMVLGPGGAAWVGVKVGLNGVKSDVRQIRDEVKDIGRRVNTNERAISYMEGQKEGAAHE